MKRGFWPCVVEFVFVFAIAAERLYFPTDYMKGKLEGEGNKSLGG